MTITQTIQAYKAAKAKEHRLRDLPNSQYDLAAHYAAVDRSSALAYRMINHKDWSAALQDEHYPQAAIPYPVSC